ncbi:hypothetical protein Tcan_18645 [Toxocara canis]|uniref:Uncharacterized protein n=1 Tax=Toxocara canis TaxID=6265 RepID=A0A0B2UX70_TOXCA|nr:hypothetical protein Tcan_18645 [Toxocara canis]
MNQEEERLAEGAFMVEVIKFASFSGDPVLRQLRAPKTAVHLFSLLMFSYSEHPFNHSTFGDDPQMNDQKCACVICGRYIDNRESSAVLFPKDEPRMSQWIKALKIPNVEEFIWKLEKRSIAFACHYHVASLRRNHAKVYSPYDRPRLNPKYASLYQTASTAIVAVSNAKPAVSAAPILTVVRSKDGYCCYCKTKSNGIFVRMPDEANVRALWYARMGFFNATIERAISIGDYEKTLLCVEHFARFFRGTVMYFAENFPYSYQDHIYGARFLNVSITSTDTLIEHSKHLTDDTATISHGNDESVPGECSVNCETVFGRSLDQGFRIIKRELLDTEADSMSTAVGSDREDRDLIAPVGEVKKEPPDSPTDQEHSSFSKTKVEIVEDSDTMAKLNSSV